tara:strand:+ start:488 stop:628 length:141 start_codon:yes stop_codon:yes gene_type:complete
MNVIIVLLEDGIPNVFVEIGLDCLIRFLSNLTSIFKNKILKKNTII